MVADIIDIRPALDLGVLIRAASDLSSGKAVAGYLTLVDPQGNVKTVPLGTAPAIPLQKIPD